MKLSEVAIKRPVFATVMSLTILLMGCLLYTSDAADDASSV